MHAYLEVSALQHAYRRVIKVIDFSFFFFFDGSRTILLVQKHITKVEFIS